MHENERFEARRRGLLVAAALLPLGTSYLPKVLAQGGGKIKIGVIGSGRLGGTVGALWEKAGHPVMFSSRHPEELKEMVGKLGALARAGSVQQAIAFGDVVLIVVPYAALPKIGDEHRDALRGKVVLDACNAVASRDGPELRNEVDQNGIGVTSQKYLPGARVVRAFNTLSSAILAREANRAEPRLAIPIAGDDREAVDVAAKLVRDAGFEPVVVGKLKDASRFQQGAPGYGQNVTAAELRRTLSLSP
ncbi:MAG TPA: NADPH-dependent F420 reductase [Casimicrobiaceae bacterium]|nr:NADPH-dependent F420 reductase [Casimicrobiaceae bacterium]